MKESSFVAHEPGDLPLKLGFTHLEAPFNLRYNNTLIRGDIYADKKQRDLGRRVAFWA